MFLGSWSLPPSSEYITLTFGFLVTSTFFFFFTLILLPSSCDCTGEILLYYTNGPISRFLTTSAKSLLPWKVTCS